MFARRCDQFGLACLPLALLSLAAHLSLAYLSLALESVMKAAGPDAPYTQILAKHVHGGAGTTCNECDNDCEMHTM